MKSWITALVLLAVALSPLTAAENGGLLVDVQKVSLERHDRVEPGETRVDRNMALKVNIRNTSMKGMPATTLKYVVLVQKWGSSGSIMRIQGEVKLDELPASRSVSVNAGEIHIQGYMYAGNSDRYVDRIAGWKITIARDGRALEFLSSTSFDVLNRRADRND